MRPTQIEKVIQLAYETRLRQNPSGKPLGWRLLYSPRRVLEGARVAFIGTIFEIQRRWSPYGH